MSSQSRTSAPCSVYTPSGAPFSVAVYRRGAPSESLWVHSTPGERRLIARPEASTTAGASRLPCAAPAA